MKMKKQNRFSLQLSTLSFWAVLILILPASFVVAQDKEAHKGHDHGAQQEVPEPVAPTVEKIVGTWKIDMEKSEEVMSEEGFLMMSQMGEQGISLMFGAEGDFSMNVMGDLQEDAIFTIAEVDGEENLYSIIVTRPDRTLNAKALFTDENTIKFMPNGEEPAILVRVVEEEGAMEEGGMKEGDERWLKEDDEKRVVCCLRI